MLELLRQFGDTTVVELAQQAESSSRSKFVNQGIPHGLAHTICGAARGELAAKPQRTRH